MKQETIAHSPFSLQQRRHDLLSVSAVVCITLVALLLGLVVRYSVEGRARIVARQNLVAAVPSGWVVQNGVGELVFQARNPLAPSQQIQVSLLPSSDDLASLAASRSLSRGRLNITYRVLDESPAKVNGQLGYRVHYAYVNLRSTGLPIIIEGLVYYHAANEKIVAVAYENQQPQFEPSLPQFERFLRTVQYGPGD